MLVQLTGLDPIWTLFTVIGILTLFGKKKKDEKDGETGESSTTMATSTPTSPTTLPPIHPSPVPASSATTSNPAPVNTSGSYQPQRGWSVPPQGDEDSSLSRLLQSLLRDLPSDTNAMGGEQPGAFTTQGLSEWIPPRATPTSRPMVIVPGAKKGSEQDKPAPSPAPGAIPTVPWNPPSAAASTIAPKPQVPAPSAKPPDAETPKPASQLKVSPPPPPDKLAQPTKQEAPKRPSAPKASQSFDHIFELTQGSFDGPGLIVVNGSTESGKTTLCSGLASSFLKQGNPCMFVTYDKPPSALRDQMKKLNFDPSEPESNYRLLLVDGFSSQSDSFSFEPYYVEKAFDFDSIQDALVKNSSMFIGEKTKILFDSLDQIVAKVDPKDFVKHLGETMDKLRDSSVTLVVTIDLSKAPKEVVKWLEDTAACVIDLDKDDSDPNGRELKVRKLNGSNSKIDSETFEIDSGKGLVFIK